MKHISFALMTAILVITCCSCSADAVQNSSEANSPKASENTTDAVLLTTEIDLPPEADKNEPQTFTKDFDGIVMTVTTDKTEYLFDEIIKVKAVVKNTTNETIGLYVHTSTFGIHQEISTIITRDGKYLIDPVADSGMNAAVAILNIDPGKEYVQDMDFQTYCYDDDALSGKAPAEKGLYSGKCAISVLSDPTSIHSDYTTHLVEFSLTLK